MNLKEAIQSDLSSALLVVGSMFGDLTYRIPSSKDRDPQTMELTVTFDLFPLKGLIESYKQHEVEASFGKVDLTDKKITIPRKGLSIEISSQGQMLIGDEVYSILNVQTDPTDSVYTIQVRK